jgi:hypothetical protein
MIAILATNNFLKKNFDLWTIYCGQYHPCNHEYSCNVHIATPFVLRGYYIARIFKITITHDNCWSVFIFCDLWFHVVLGVNHLQSGFMLHFFSMMSDKISKFLQFGCLGFLIVNSMEFEFIRQNLFISQCFLKWT